MKTTIVTKAEVLKRYKIIANDTHKGIQGHALLIAGSYGKMGAAVLATKTCLKAGCGLVTAYVPACGYDILQISNPEVMTLTDNADRNIAEIRFDIKPQAIGIGPGLGTAKETQAAVHAFLKCNVVPLVVDADALNILSKNKDWLSLLPSETIVTPHPKELERLIGAWENDEEKWDKTIAFSKKHDIVVVMKGAPTYIVYKAQIFENATGNAALATAGSGDSLTGIITSLVAQKYDPIDAAILGVYLHGLTADIALPELGYQAFIASDIHTYLGKAYLSLNQ